MHDITRDGNPVLRQIAKPLTFPLSDEYKKLADDMMEYLINSQDPKIAEKHQLRAGVGLAAPQVGESVQMAALLVPNDKGEIIFKEVFYLFGKESAEELQLVLDESDSDLLAQYINRISSILKDSVQDKKDSIASLESLTNSVNELTQENASLKRQLITLSPVWTVN